MNRAALAAALLLASSAARADDPPARDYDAESEQRSEFWERALEPDRDEYLAKLDQGKRLLNEGDTRSLELAETLLREATHLVPDDPRAHFWLGRVHYRRAHELSRGLRQGAGIGKEWTACARSLTKAYDLDASFTPGDDAPKWMLDFDVARCDAGAGAYEESIAHLKRILTGGFTEVARVHTLLAEVYMALGRLDEAIASFETARRLKSPHDAELNFSLAVAYDRAGMLARARERLRSALRREPGLNSLWAHGKTYVPPGDEDYYLGLAYQGKRELPRALYYFRRYLALSGDSPWTRRAREHLEKVRAYRLSDALAIKGTATVDRARAAAIVARADGDLQRCVAPAPNLLLEVRIVRYVAAHKEAEDPAKNSGLRPGVRVIPQQFFGESTDESLAAIQCVDRVASALEMPRPSGSGSAYVEFELPVIARSEP